MKCEKCKSREATVVVTEVDGNKRTEHYYCSQCAAEMDLLPSEGELPFGQLLSGILGMVAENDTEEEDEYAGIFCPTCKTSYREFVDCSRFGCEDCYHIFGPLIDANIHKLQGSDAHTGKHPKLQGKKAQPAEKTEELTAEEKIARLRVRLQEALAAEDYEQAVVCRDEIKALSGEK